MKYFFLLLSVCLFSCTGNKKPNVSNIDVDITIQRLDQDIFKDDVNNLPAKYGRFFDIYTHNIVKIGGYKDSLFSENLKMFQTNNIVDTARNKVSEIFPNLNNINSKLTQAFKYYKYYFPESLVPNIYSYISGFNQSIVLTDSVIGIGLDKYLGVDYDIYPDLGIHKYQTKNMFKDKIPSDCISAWIGSEWEIDIFKHNDLISQMIHKGKILYATKLMLPNEADSLIFGFTREQIKWCKNNEKNMWVELIDQKLIFSTDHLSIIKLTEDAPYTSIFTGESPGKACNWIGYNIVSAYMKKNPEQSLKELMENVDYHAILEKSKYRP